MASQREVLEEGLRKDSFLPVCRDTGQQPGMGTPSRWNVAVCAQGLLSPLGKEGCCQSSGCRSAVKCRGTRVAFWVLGYLCDIYWVSIPSSKNLPWISEVFLY